MRCHLALIAVVVFELSCHAYTPSGVVSKDFSFEWDGQEKGELTLAPDFLYSLQHGFCIFGPVDQEMRTQQLRDFIRDNYPHLKPPLEELQGVPAPRKINHDNTHRNSTFTVQRSDNVAPSADR